MSYSHGGFSGSAERGIELLLRQSDRRHRAAPLARALPMSPNAEPGMGRE